MSKPQLSQLAAELLAGAAEGELPAPSPERRARGIGVVLGALRARARARFRLRVSLGVASAAAVLGVLGARHAGFFQARPSTSSVSQAAAVAEDSARIVAHPEGTGANVGGAGDADGRPLPAAYAIRTGSHLTTPAGGGAAMELSTGTELELEEKTDVSVLGDGADGATQSFALVAGALGAHVAKLRAGERFLVRSPDAEIEVRGTRFRVSIVAADPTCGGGTVTRLTVTEGVVAVRHAGTEVLVGRGGSWPEGCAVARTAASHDPPPARSGSAGAHPIVAGEVPSQRSTLAEQNALFASATAASGRGDRADAIARFTQFVAAYPESPLAESAVVQRMRLLGGQDPSAARKAAHEYLQRYPSGFARAEAEAIESGSP